MSPPALSHHLFLPQHQRPGAITLCPFVLLPRALLSDCPESRQAPCFPDGSLPSLPYLHMAIKTHFTYTCGIRGRPLLLVLITFDQVNRVKDTSPSKVHKSMRECTWSPRACFGSLGLEALPQDFPGEPVVKIPCFQCRGTSSIPGLGTKMPHGMAKNTPQKTTKEALPTLNLWEGRRGGLWQDGPRS